MLRFISIVSYGTAAYAAYLDDFVGAALLLLGSTYLILHAIYDRMEKKK